MHFLLLCIIAFSLQSFQGVVMSSKKVSLHWFRKGLRLHDNPALLGAVKQTDHLYPVFCLDPHFAHPQYVGVNRFNFLLESLHDLDRSLRRLGSRLYVIQGKPQEALLKAVDHWGVNHVTFERDTEPYAKVRDKEVRALLESKGVLVESFVSHTLHDLDAYLSFGPPPVTYQSFLKLFGKLRSPCSALPAPTSLPPPRGDGDGGIGDCCIPALSAFAYPSPPTTPFKGGETEALLRLSALVLERPAWVRRFEKPQTAPTSLEPSTTVLSPYLKFGCLSARHFYHALAAINNSPGSAAPTQPPVSLTGQLLWREFFYLNAHNNSLFHTSQNNKQCKQIPWGWDRRAADAVGVGNGGHAASTRQPAASQSQQGAAPGGLGLVDKWERAQTGFPLVDALMTQLIRQGWVHHLGRHLLACFLTRGDLFQHWEEGARVFDYYLLDADYALNNANWQWLSCSNFFYQYFRVYSPISFTQKTDPSGLFIRHHLPALRLLHDKFIYCPWLAPEAVLAKAKLRLVKQLGAGPLEQGWSEYPLPIVDHAQASKQNIEKMKMAYASQGAGGDEEDKIEEGIIKGKRGAADAVSTTASKKSKS